MELGDARKLSQEGQEVLRYRAVRLVVEERRKQGEVARLLGVARGTVNRWIGVYRRHGERGLAKGKRGRRAGAQMRLSDVQAAQIKRLITDKCPDQLKLPFALWTRAAVRELIARKVGVLLPVSTVGYYLRRWGFTAQKPARRAIERDDARVLRWLGEEYPGIAARARREGAEIHWGDETALVSGPAQARSYAPRGKTPVVKTAAQRFSASMISSVTNRGKLRFMVYDGAMRADTFIAFLRRLIRDAGRKVFLIVDNLRVHHARKVKAWVGRHRDRIELFYLPPYAPEHNPDEFLNNDVKRNANSKRIPGNAEEMKQNLRSYMKSVQRRPQRIMSYFRAETVKYAA
jgi:transposase